MLTIIIMYIKLFIIYSYGICVNSEQRIWLKVRLRDRAQPLL